MATTILKPSPGGLNLSRCSPIRGVVSPAKQVFQLAINVITIPIQLLQCRVFAILLIGWSLYVGVWHTGAKMMHRCCISRSTHRKYRNWAGACVPISSWVITFARCISQFLLPTDEIFCGKSLNYGWLATARGRHHFFPEQARVHFFQSKLTRNGSN